MIRDWPAGTEILTRLTNSAFDNKRTRKMSLAAELLAVLRKAPKVTIVKVADGVDDNWTFLSGELPAGEEALDFFRRCADLAHEVGEVLRANVGEHQLPDVRQHVMREPATIVFPIEVVRPALVGLAAHARSRQASSQYSCPR